MTLTRDHVLLHLTPTEHRLLCLLSEGLTAKEAARSMGVKVRSVYAYTVRLYNALGLEKGEGTHVRAINKAREIGLL